MTDDLFDKPAADPFVPLDADSLIAEMKKCAPARPTGHSWALARTRADKWLKKGVAASDLLIGWQNYCAIQRELGHVGTPKGEFCKRLETFLSIKGAHWRGFLEKAPETAAQEPVAAILTHLGVPEGPAGRIGTLFGWFTAVFGAKWKPEPLRETAVAWLQATDGFTQDSFRRGCHEVKKAGMSWPPSAVEFARLARGSRLPYHNKFPRDRQLEYRPERDPDATRTVRNEARARVGLPPSEY